MAQDIPASAGGGSSSFRKVAAAFLAGGALPFARILSAERVERVFAKHDGLFGRQGIYSTAMMVWSFLGQVLRDGKDASCQAAVARVVSYCGHEQIAPPTADTGDYCRARAKLSEAALHELSCEVAAETEAAAAADWLWKNKHAKLIDGFTFTMAVCHDEDSAGPSGAVGDRVRAAVESSAGAGAPGIGRVAVRPGAPGSWILWADQEELDRLKRLRTCPHTWCEQPLFHQLTTPKSQTENK